MHRIGTAFLGDVDDLGDVEIAVGGALASQTERRCDVVIVARSEVLGAKLQTLVADLSIAIDRAKPHKPREAAFADRRRPPPKRGTPSQA